MFMKTSCVHWLGLVLALASIDSPVEAQVIPLWTNGAPGFEERRTEPERAESYWVKNVHQPTLTAFIPPAEKSTGIAILICPGGGHKELVFKAEGLEPASYFVERGIAAFALKYRLGREEGSPYRIEVHAREDAERAMRVIRTRAREWNIDPSRVGAMGFSAGGEVVSMIAYGSGAGDRRAVDPVDRANSRPDFQILIYPGPLGLPDVVPAGAPPAFFLAADDDRGPAHILTVLTQKYRTAQLPVEFHLLARGGHAFNMGTRSKYQSVRAWPELLTHWLTDNFMASAPRTSVK